MALAGLGTDLAVELAPLRVHHWNGIRNGFGSILNQAVQPIVFAHVTEEVFLRPSGEERRRQRGHWRLKVRGQDGSLMPAVAALADLPHPELVGQLRPALR